MSCSVARPIFLCQRAVNTWGSQECPTCFRIFGIFGNVDVFYCQLRTQAIASVIVMLSGDLSDRAAAVRLLLFLLVGFLCATCVLVVSLDGWIQSMLPPMPGLDALPRDAETKSWDDIARKLFKRGARR